MIMPKPPSEVIFKKYALYRMNISKQVIMSIVLEIPLIGAILRSLNLLSKTCIKLV